MPAGVFIINGIRISFQLIEAAIQWAQQNKGSLTGIYMYSGEKNAESYGFPSDIEQVETEVSENEGEAELDALIHNNSKYAEKQGAQNNITITTRLLKNPDIETLRPLLQSAVVVWLDPDSFQEEAASDFTAFTIEDLRKLTNAMIVEISQ